MTIDHAQFVIERTFDASPAQVFAAWKDPAAKRRWFGGRELFTTDIHELDVREGGEERLVGVMANGMSLENNTRYFDVVENARIVFAYAMIVDGARISVSLSTIELAEAGEGTRFVYTEQAAFFENADGPDLRKEGWSTLFDSLAQELAQ